MYIELWPEKLPELERQQQNRSLSHERCNQINWGYPSIAKKRNQSYKTK